MARLTYKIQFNFEFDIHELEKLLTKANNVVKNLGLALHDYNYGLYQEDLGLLEVDSQIPLFIKETDKFDYLSGYLDGDETVISADTDSVLREFKDVILKNFLNQVVNVYIRETYGLVDDRHFVEIPDKSEISPT